MAAPKGNKFASHAKPFMNAIERAIKQEDGKRLRAAAEKLLDAAAAGESWAIGMLADRIDGKPAQQVAIDGDMNMTHTVTEVALKSL
jgi:HPt (histidine-containing phosphotransfer) domain-containing protein